MSANVFVLHSILEAMHQRSLHLRLFAFIRGSRDFPSFGELEITKKNLSVDR
jgi:hypothetical protein